MMVHNTLALALALVMSVTVSALPPMTCNGIRDCEALGTCTGEYACERVGSVILGQGACTGDHSCQNSLCVDIGKNACTGWQSCRSIGENINGCTGSWRITIGRDACMCDNCCRCLEPGDYVKEFTCNTPGECCTIVANGEKSVEFVKNPEVYIGSYLRDGEGEDGEDAPFLRGYGTSY
mmetsp:Transcript_3942/g.5988  ORF Transcript_3942/g.5988 Transcript_3942/m.5988 type:complete len:179 (-) Transcript_3942:103-639(-)